MNERLEELIRTSSQRDQDQPAYKICGEGLRIQYEETRQKAIESGEPWFYLFYMIEEKNGDQLHFQVLKEKFDV